MTKRDRSENMLSYDVSDKALSKTIDGILEELQPYSNLNLLREIFVTGVKLARENSGRGDVKILRTAVKELRYAFKVFAPYRDVPKISIFGSARSQPEDSEFQAALDLGQKMVKAGYMVITGAGPGIMEAGLQGAGRENSFGLNIQLPFEQGANQVISGDNKLINFRFFFTRKLFFVKESKAIVLMPGGFGTHDEGFETLTLVQTGRSEPTPIVMLDAPGGTYWKSWQRFVREQLFDRGYVSPQDESLFFVTDNVEEACIEIEKFYRLYHSSRYVDRRRQLVLRLKAILSKDSIEILNQEFQDILSDGVIESCKPFPEENNEPDLLELPRLSLFFNQRDFGRLRQLIDRINDL